jgi:hypothetical protein
MVEVIAVLNINCLFRWDYGLILCSFLVLSILYQDGVSPRITGPYLSFQFIYVLEQSNKPFLGLFCENSVTKILIWILAIAGFLLLLAAHLRTKNLDGTDNHSCFLGYIGLLVFISGILLQSRSILLFVLSNVIFMACFAQIRSEREEMKSCP